MTYLNERRRRKKQRRRRQRSAAGPPKENSAKNWFKNAVSRKQQVSVVAGHESGDKSSDAFDLFDFVP